MNKISAAWAVAALTLAANAWAAPLVTYTHNYGNGVGQVDPGGNDALGNGYVTVSDHSSQRFNDSFDFSGLSYGSIDYFDLTLTYAKTDDTYLWIFPEAWYVRPGAAPSPDSAFKLDRVGSTATSDTFRIDATLTPFFQNMVSAENFYFWFAEEALGRNSFTLYSAALEINGTTAGATVPESGSLLLLGAGLLGLGLIRRRVVG